MMNGILPGKQKGYIYDHIRIKFFAYGRMNFCNLPIRRIHHLYLSRTHLAKKVNPMHELQPKQIMSKLLRAQADINRLVKQFKVANGESLVEEKKPKPKPKTKTKRTLFSDTAAKDKPKAKPKAKAKSKSTTKKKK